MDDLHFDATGQRILGERFAAGYATLVPPAGDFTAWISNPVFGIDPAKRGFTDDPDGDGLDNGLEAWFGTHPGPFSAGLAMQSKTGNTFIFTHPHNPDAPNDVTGYCQWSPNLVDWHVGDSVAGRPGGPALTIVTESAANTTTVTSVSSAVIPKVFVRAVAIHGDGNGSGN